MKGGNSHRVEKMFNKMVEKGPRPTAHTLSLVSIEHAEYVYDFIGV